MSKQFMLKDGTVMSATDTSTIGDICLVFASSQEMAAIYDKITADNLAEVTVEEKKYARVLSGVALSGHGTIEMRIRTSEKLTEREERLQKEVEKKNAEISKQGAEILGYENSIIPRLDVAEEEITGAQEALAEVYELAIGGA